MKCKTCKKKIKLLDSYGDLLKIFDYYCDRCWFEILIREHKQSIVYHKESIKDDKYNIKRYEDELT